MITRTCILPPQIQQYFDSTLLSIDCKFREDSETLWLIYLYIKDKLMKKTKKYPDWEKKCQALEAKFLEMYERIKIKEEERKEEEDHCTKEFFYSIGGFTHPKRKLLQGLKWRSKGLSYSFVR